MTLPNPTLDSIICDVVAWLPNEDQRNVLLYAMESLPVLDVKYVDHISAQDPPTTTPYIKLQGSNREHGRVFLPGPIQVSGL